MADDQKPFPVPDVPLPPREFRDHDDDTYVKMARYNVRVVNEEIPLRANMHVVDVGCSSGRLALPLLGFLDPSQGGAYIGFDVVEAQIEWARANITKNWPHFTFEWVDVHNSQYNPSGRRSANSVRFPVPDGFADAVLVHSVFTHLMESAVSRYVKELRRVLALGGYGYITLFLWNVEAESATAVGSSAWTFPYVEGNVRVHDSAAPEHVVTIRDDFLRAELAKNGLEVVRTRYGSWRDGHAHAEDFVIVRRVPG